MENAFKVLTVGAFACLLSLNVQAQSYLKHEVKYGETIYSIPVHYGISTKKFVALNNITNENLELKPGTVVAIRELTEHEIAQKQKVTSGTDGSGSAKSKQTNSSGASSYAASNTTNDVRDWGTASNSESYGSDNQSIDMERIAAEAKAAARIAYEKETAETRLAQYNARVTNDRENAATTWPVSEEDLTIGSNGVRYTRSKNGYHVVQKQQTMYHLAKLYNTTIEDLQRINNLSGTELTIGQQLRVRN